MENTSTKLSFPQRNWFLLCILCAVLSPLIVHWVSGTADKMTYTNAMNQKKAGDDTSYRVATPPSPAPSGGDSAMRGADTSRHGQ